MRHILEKIIDWLYNLIGYCPKQIAKQFDDLVCPDRENTCTEETSFQERIDRIRNVLMESNERIQKLEDQIEECSMLDMKELLEINNQLTEDNQKLMKEIEKSEEYYHKVQVQVSDILHGDKTFGFGRNPCIPGSTSLMSEKVEDSIRVYGRTIFTDVLAERIKQEPSVRNKFQMAYSELLRNGLIDKLVRQLVSLGAISMTLGFNENNTTLEVYYTLEAVHHESIYLGEDEEDKEKE